MSSEQSGPKEWLRCNNCYILMRKCKAPFFLSFCSHIFCSKCVKIAVKKCPQCQTKNLRTMPLVEPLSPEVKHCFEPLEDLIEQMQQATMFQNQQWTISNQRLSNVEKKYISLKVAYQRMNEALKMSQQRFQEVQKELNALRKQIYDHEEAQKKRRYLQHSSTILTPQSLTDSAHSIGSSSPSDVKNQPFAKKKSYHNSLRTQFTPTKLEEMDLNFEFRIPTITKVPRSVGSSSRNSSQSSVGTPSTIYSSSPRK